MSLKRILTGVLAGVIASTIIFTDAFFVGNSAIANERPTVTLSGTATLNEPGVVNDKMILMSSEREAKLNYRLYANYTQGFAQGARVTLFLPSLAYDETSGEYRVVDRSEPATELGVQARLASAGGWSVVSPQGSEPFKGGQIVLEYDGDVGAGANPSFDILLSTYNDGTSGPYGSVPEGTAFEIHGFVSYDTFDRVPGTGWETPGAVDEESRVAVISSDLQWESSIDPRPKPVDSDKAPPVPMWDRYQYINYTYQLENTSRNLKSNIDGYTVSLDLQTTADRNGIIPFDINRFQYEEGVGAIPNPNPNNRNGMFVGVPGEGGVLIYDITNWDGNSDLTGQELPYIDSGSGYITFDRETGESKDPVGASAHREYMISLPLSRQGFPDLPTNFKVRAITNVLFAKTANWTKTEAVDREITTPDYAFDFSHAPEQAQVILGNETFTELKGFVNTSNAPVFNPSIMYPVHEDVTADRVTFEYTTSDSSRFEDLTLSYPHLDKAGNLTTSNIDGVREALDDGSGMTRVTFDVSDLARTAEGWDRTLTFGGLAEQLNPGATIPLSIKVYVTPHQLDVKQFPAVASFLEKFASNDDFSVPTTYDTVTHTVERATQFTVIAPKELVPSTSIVGVYGDRRTQNPTQTLVPYEAPFQAEYLLSTGEGLAPEFTYTIDMLASSKGVGEAVETQVTLTEALLNAASDVALTVSYSDGSDEEFTDFTDPIALSGAKTATAIVITGKNLHLSPTQAIAVVDYDSSLDLGESQKLRGVFVGEQLPPFTGNKTVTAENTVHVSDTKTDIEIEGVNQVTKPSGAGNSYDQWVDRDWDCSSCSYTHDRTLDQGYKTLGGFVSSIVRPSETYRNNDQTVVVDVELPHEHFDMYYMKIRDDLRPYLTGTVDIYRMVNGTEELWQRVPADQWANNTAEGNFWRIATARPENTGAALSTSFSDVNILGHTYYKDPFADDVVPESPVSRVQYTLNFEREGANAKPQLSGKTSRVVEYMGRFYEATEGAKQATKSSTLDTFGTVTPVTREDEADPVFSIVQHPYAKSATGAQDSPATASKTVGMGDEAEYLASIWNVNNNYPWSLYRGHGPDEYTPVATEFDEWLYNFDPSSFHDKMSYEFTYPASPKQNAVYNFDATKFTLPNNTAMPYMTTLRVDFDNGTQATLDIDEGLLADFEAADGLTVKYDNTLTAGFHKLTDGEYAVSAGEEESYPRRFESFYEQIDGFGDKTAELQGDAADALGQNLNEIDARIAGHVNGNQNLVGTSKLYREPNGADRGLMHTSTATLVGQTLRLGAVMDLTFDSMEVYDYAIDGVTPNTFTVGAGMRNDEEADIVDFDLTVEFDSSFRTQKLTIPAAVFDGQWEAKKLVLKQSTGDVEIGLDSFVREGDDYVLELEPLFADGTLTTRNYNVTFGGASTLQEKRITSAILSLSATRDSDGDPVARMWGSAARNGNESLPDRIIPGSYLYATGVWVDETAPDGTGTTHNWDSKPNRYGQGAKVQTGSWFRTDFTVRGSNLQATQTFVKDGGWNPSSRYNSSLTSPAVYTRGALLQFSGVALTDDLTAAAGNKRIYDADTEAQINFDSMVVGDTIKVLYELKNNAVPGSQYLPVFSPAAHFTSPTGTNITGVEVITDDSAAALRSLITEAGKHRVSVTDLQFTISDGANPGKRRDVVFNDLVLTHQESVFVLVDYIAVDDFSGSSETATQNNSVYTYSYARPSYTHHLQNYTAAGVSGNGLTQNDTITSDYDGDGTNESLARIYLHNKFADIRNLAITSSFDEESLSGTGMTVTVKNIENEILHSNTTMLVDVTLDTRQRGFKLTELPKPEYPAGFTGQYSKPKVLIKDGDDWVTFDADVHDLENVNEIRVDYGIVPADHAGTVFRAPDFQIVGIGHWQNHNNQPVAKSYDLYSQAVITLSHRNGGDADNPIIANYTLSKNVYSRIYKALPRVEFNLQSFDTKEEAAAPYTDTSLGKTAYLPGDAVFMKLTARNENAAKNINTGYGKAPLEKPVIFDKVPEYITKTSLDKFVSDGELDVQAAVDAGALEIRHYGADGALRAEVGLPEVTVEKVEGLDVGGAQQFKNVWSNQALNAEGHHTDALGLLSAEGTHPKDVKENPTQNPAQNTAEPISFTLFTYSFPEDLGRGERIEVMYAGDIRTDDLPFATYTDGRPVYAPLLGWYNNSEPVAATAQSFDLDMAALLHDAGLSGERSHETAANEFLMFSSAWTPGRATERLRPESWYSRQDTYYDASADSRYTHRSSLIEDASSQTYEGTISVDGFSQGEPDDNYRFANIARVSDGVVTHRNSKGQTERILWAQDGMQLSRAWLYATSEMVPEVTRDPKHHDPDPANFYEYDGDLKKPTYIAAHSTDDFSYAVQLDEEFTVRLEATNLGDRSIESGLVYTEILPVGIAPVIAEGETLPEIVVTDRAGNPVDPGRVAVKMLQTPTSDKGYRAPNQSQEAGTYQASNTADGVPYVLEITVTGELDAMYLSETATLNSKHQLVEIPVVVTDESKLVRDDNQRVYWYDQLTVTTVAAEEYLEVYSKDYGLFTRNPNSMNPDRFKQDAMTAGINQSDMRWSQSSSTWLSFEPVGTYIRGLNAQGTKIEQDGKPAIVTGDQVAMRNPTLRVWNTTMKDAYTGKYDNSVEQLTVELYEQFTVNSIVENQQVETASGYFSSAGVADNLYKHQPQTTGGARGSWFDPTVTITLPYGIVPVLEGGTIADYPQDVAEQQDITFTATVNDVTHSTSAVAEDLAEHFNVAVSRVNSDQGERFILTFTAKETASAEAALHEIKFGQSLNISPRVAVVDEPHYSDSDSGVKYQEIITVAHSERPVFLPVVVAQRPTGSPASGPAIDNARRDSTGDGMLKVDDAPISETLRALNADEVPLHVGGAWKAPVADLVSEKVPASDVNAAAYGGTQLTLRVPRIVNDTKTGLFVDGAFGNEQLVDAAGKYWVSTEITNGPGNGSDYDKIRNSGVVHHSQLEVSTHITNFVEKTGEVYLEVDGQKLNRKQFEDAGYRVEALTKSERHADADETDPRQVITWLVTTPAGPNSSAGHLASGEQVTLLFQVEMVDGFDEVNLDDTAVWSDPSLTVDSYVALISDNTALRGKGMSEDDFITQSVKEMAYVNRVDEDVENTDFNADGDKHSVFAHDYAVTTISKPHGEVRVNTSRPRLEYSNGKTGDAYFNSSDTVEYLVTLAKNTGSAVKELVVDLSLPSHESDDDSIKVSDFELIRTPLYASSGKWEIPDEILKRISDAELTVDDVFETAVYISAEKPLPGYETGAEWTKLGTSSVLKNTEFEIPREPRNNEQKVRVVVRSIHEDFMVPTGMRLDIDAVTDDVTQPSSLGDQEVTESDPENLSTKHYPTTVTDNAIRVGLEAATQEGEATQYIYGTTQLWGNYIATSMALFDQSEARSYLTPSRPVVNVLHTAKYYRAESGVPQDERFHWSTNTAIRTDISPHLKFQAEMVNADESMWDEETEGHIYSEDILINPTVSFELPSIMRVGSDFTYVDKDEVTPDHPLSDAHRSRYSLPPEAAHQWTWKLVRADGTEASDKSYLKHTEFHAGSWGNLDRNVVSVWFEGMVYPGDKIVIDFIGEIREYVPGATSDDIQSKVYTTNNTGLVQPLNSLWNRENRLGYMTDRNDLDGNDQFNERLVFAERSVFSFETYDNFNKRKVAYSDLNRAGTVSPMLTPVREGGSFQFETSLDNSKEAADTPYPYPIMYDVLPHVGDTAIMYSNVARNSMSESRLDLDSVKLKIEGAENKYYDSGEYTVFVGPFKREGSQLVKADLIDHAKVATEAFYSELKTPGEASATRDDHFVTLAQLKQALNTQPELIDEVQTLLVMFNKADAVLPGQSKLKLEYQMVAPLNAPVFLETWNTEATKNDYAQWNSFVGMQRKPGFLPQESNNAGVYVTERAESVSIGNYVWNDTNYNALQDEGDPYVDENGRTLLRPSKDLNFDGTIDDPGINGVKVTLLSQNGNLVDSAGNAVRREDGVWVVIDDVTGEVITDAIGEVRTSTGELTTVTRTDVHGNAGYYVFSNISPGDYRVMFEFPGEYDRFSVTTMEILGNTGVEVFVPGVEDHVPAVSSTDALVAITEPKGVVTSTPDDIRMGFDLGVAQMVTFGGTVWNDEDRNGGINGAEKGLPDYEVVLLDTAGNVVDTTLSSSVDGTYEFTLLPLDREYKIEIKHPGGAYNYAWPVSPVMHAHDPFELTDDNDGFLVKAEDDRFVFTNTLSFDLQGLFQSGFADRTGVNVGFYERNETAVIGNRVWDDLNKNGIQDEGEPGVAGQQLELLQFAENEEGDWVQTSSFPSTVATSNADGYYAFSSVPVSYRQGMEEFEYRYQVVVKNLVPGYNFTTALQGEDRSLDSDFSMNGRMDGGDTAGEHLIAVAELEQDLLVAVDNNTIDLGLRAHDTAVIAGEIFIDHTEDGLMHGDHLADEVYVATLQVSTDGTNWSDVAQQVDVNRYRFEGVALYNETARVLNQYRVVVSEIPTWLVLTEHNAGDDDAVDSDFVEAARDVMVVAISDIYTVAELSTGHLLPVDTRTAINHEDVDLGLIEPKATVGGRAWEDANLDGVQDADEVPIAGQVVTLQELVDGEWVDAEDVQGKGTAVTGEDGSYLFNVAPTHYSNAHPQFLQPRRYRVISDRAGYQVWSPIHATDDRLLDSDMLENPVGEKPAHRATSVEFAIVDVVPGSDAIDGNTLRDDLHMDLGLKTYADRVTLGGAVWAETSEDGVRQSSEQPLAGRTVTLMELVDDEWVVVEDLNGNSTQRTGEDGRYQFVVEPTHWDEDHDGYLAPREYRTVTDTPANHRLSEGESVTAEDTGSLIRSKVAELVTLDEETGLIDISASQVDEDLDYPYVFVPLALTGGAGLALLGMAGVGVLVLGSGILLLALKRRKREETRLI